MKLSEELKYRGLIENVSNEDIYEKLDKEKVKFYIGFDPTASSIQIGNFLSVVTMKRLQDAGHTPYILVGGATGMIGDPSGKSAERNLLEGDILNQNVEALKKQLSKYLRFDGDNAAVLVNNYDWIGKFSFLEFLRVVGKRFRLSDMLAKESVKSRINSEAGISYTEFSYQMIQACDFAHLAHEFDVTLQMGGGDQWGNITAGIDFTRKLHSKQVYGAVTPLVTDSSGKKFGKSEGGAIYIDADKTSPYQMYQFLLNSDDSKVIQYLLYYTFLSLDEISELKTKTESEPHLRAAQKALATEVVRFAHGSEGLDAAMRATSFFFGGTIEKVTDKEVASIFADVPSVEMTRDSLEAGIPILDLLSELPLFKSKGEARRSVGQKGVYLNNIQVAGDDYVVTSKDLASESSLVFRKGKKNYCVVTFK
ncbi:MAG: tyrosine--tRNA ligase [Halobacteriovoraceae bacterium]|nr:tyrosine--tRNA ligase [Halobacteriovoraceae bacterium]|tara:strand:- start:87062 stop:88330 length:1269 start_codon:yes stop_codon:yes gene_type:complete